MKRLYVIEDLCNGCRLCQTFCSSLAEGVFSAEGRIRVLKPGGDAQDIPIVDCSGSCLRPLFDAQMPTCVSVCPTGAILYEEAASAAERRLLLAEARRRHSLFKVVAPWKWPFAWQGMPPQEGDAR